VAVAVVVGVALRRGRAQEWQKGRFCQRCPPGETVGGGAWQKAGLDGMAPSVRPPDLTFPHTGALAKRRRVLMGKARSSPGCGHRTNRGIAKD